MLFSGFAFIISDDEEDFLFGWLLLPSLFLLLILNSGLDAVDKLYQVDGSWSSVHSVLALLGSEDMLLFCTGTDSVTIVSI